MDKIKAVLEKHGFRPTWTDTVMGMAVRSGHLVMYDLNTGEAIENTVDGSEVIVTTKDDWFLDECLTNYFRNVNR